MEKEKDECFIYSSNSREKLTIRLVKKLIFVGADDIECLRRWIVKESGTSIRSVILFNF